MTYPLRLRIQMYDRCHVHHEQLEKYYHVPVLHIPQLGVLVILAAPQLARYVQTPGQDFERTEAQQARDGRVGLHIKQLLVLFSLCLLLPQKVKVFLVAVRQLLRLISFVVGSFSVSWLLVRPFGSILVAEV